MDLLSVSVQFELGELLSEELPGIAANALAAGFDSPSLRTVAGDRQPTMADTGSAFARALGEIGVAVSLHEACLLRAETLASAIASGSATPEQGGSDIYFLAKHFGALPELEPFLDAYWRAPVSDTDAEEAHRSTLLAGEARALAERIQATVALEQRARARAV